MPIITLDSSVPNKSGGCIDDTQLVWLKDVLATPAPNGSIIILHHPPVATISTLFEDHLLSNAESLAKAIEGSDVIGLLSGHTHFNSIGNFYGTTSVTCTAVLYGLDPTTTDHFRVIDSSGYNLLMVKDKKIIIQPMLISNTCNELYRWDVE